MKYFTGTVAVTANNTTVTGSGTVFDAAMVNGEFVCQGRTHRIAARVSNTQITLATGFAGTTGSGQTYHISYDSGDVGDLHDRVNSLLTQFETIGASPWGQANVSSFILSLLDDETALAARTTLGAVPSTAALAGIAGLLHANGQFTRWTGTNTAVATDIVGTVAQSGGVPTGALFQYITNANGDAVRFADGTQIAWRSQTLAASAITAAFMGGFRSGFSNAAFAAAFIAAPTAIVIPNNLTSGFSAAINTISTTAAQWCATAITSQTAADRTVGVIAVGRWYS